MVVTRVIVFTHLEDVFSYIVLIRVMSPFRGSHNLMLKSQRTTSSRPKRPARNIDFQFPCICRTFHVYSCKHTLEGAFIYSSDNIFTCVAMQYACGNISIDRPHMVVITYKYVASTCLSGCHTSLEDTIIQYTHLDGIPVSIFGNVNLGNKPEHQRVPEGKIQIQC